MMKGQARWPCVSVSGFCGPVHQAQVGFPPVWVKWKFEKLDMIYDPHSKQGTYNVALMKRP